MAGTAHGEYEGFFSEKHLGGHEKFSTCVQIDLKLRKSLDNYGRK